MRALALILALAAPLAAGAEPIDFMRDVHPVLAEHCFECHAGDNRKGGFKIDSRDTLLQGGESGPAIVPGDAASSRLIELVTTDDEIDRMPPKGRALRADEVAVLTRWINEGVAWDDNIAAANYATPVNLIEVDRPASTHVVDHYVDAYLAERNLERPAIVSDEVFLRRVYLDTIGLLPSIEELEAFQEDTRPDKRPRIVDELLARDADYAGHWMSFWNDLLRNDYEGTGYIDGGRKQISRFLHDALVNNMRYDTFVERLIDPRPAAEGFIKGIVWRGDNATVQLPAMQAARNVSQIFLGVNMKCASCHDSFIDHWQLEDAFGLANVFSDEPMELVRCDTALGKPAPYKFLWPELGEIDGSLPKRERQQRVAELVTTPENGFFTRTIVNRLWAEFFGRGLVEPLDVIEREPWHPELLDALARDLIDGGYDLKHLMRTLLTSEAYQWRAAVYEADEDEEDYVFAGPAVRRMSAEQFYDSLGQLTGAWQSNPKFLMDGEQPTEKDGPPNLQGPVRAWRISRDPLSGALGRTNREQITTRRDNNPTTLQALELTNGETLAMYLRRAARVLAQESDAGPNTMVKDLFLHALQRMPSREERLAAVELLQDPVTEEGTEDLLWVLSMLPEYQLVF